MKKLMSACAFLVFLGWAGASSATLYYFDDANVAWNTLPTEGYYGTVDVQYNSNMGLLTFVLTANSNYFTEESSGMAWDKFLFNYSGSNLGEWVTDIGIDNIKVNGSYDSTTSVSYTNVPSGGYGKFDISFADTGASKYDPMTIAIDLQELSNYTSLSINNFTSGWSSGNSVGYLFSAHLKNFYSMYGENDTSVQLGASGNSPVPEPATMLLFGTGLIGLAGIARRKVQ